MTPHHLSFFLPSFLSLPLIIPPKPIPSLLLPLQHSPSLSPRSCHLFLTHFSIPFRFIPSALLFLFLFLLQNYNSIATIPLFPPFLTSPFLFFFPFPQLSLRAVFLLSFRSSVLPHSFPSSSFPTFLPLPLSSATLPSSSTSSHYSSSSSFFSYHSLLPSPSPSSPPLSLPSFHLSSQHFSYLLSPPLPSTLKRTGSGGGVGDRTLFVKPETLRTLTRFEPYNHIFIFFLFFLFFSSVQESGV